MVTLNAAMLSWALVLGGVSAQAEEPADRLPAQASVEADGALAVPVAPSSPDSAALLERIAALEARLEALEAQTHAPPPASSEPPGLASEAAAASQEVAVPEDAPAVALGGTVIGADEEVAEAVALTGPLDVYGRVLGNAVALTGPIRVHEGAEVLGDVVSLGGQIEVAEGAVVSGERVSLGSVVSAALLEEGLPKMEGLLARMARRVAALLSLAATGVLLLAFWPRQIGRIAAVAMERPFWHGIAGLVLSSVALMTGLFLTVTLVGIPVAGLLALVVTMAWLLGFVALCFAIGDRIAPRTNRGVHWRTFLVGVVVVAAFSLVPFVGPLVLTLLGLVSIGAAAVSRFGNRMDADAP